MLIYIHYRLAGHMVAQWLEMGGGALVAMGGNCNALGWCTMNWTKILLDKSSVRQKSYEKKKNVCGHQRNRAYNRLDK